jgi:hypothetical protein
MDKYICSKCSEIHYGWSDKTICTVCGGELIKQEPNRSFLFKDISMIVKSHAMATDSVENRFKE